MSTKLQKMAVAGATVLLSGMAFVAPVFASANDDGNYTGACGTEASDNGNGGGNAYGRPLAGCAGNSQADKKNPPGQYPDGSDANNGYECDGNSGIAKTNPAHTGCTTPTGL